MAFVEICAEGLESCLAAAAGGADRVELCRNLDVGGLTPTTRDMVSVCRRLPIPVHVLIRPRKGNFVYSDVHYRRMRADIMVAKTFGASGVVLGVLNADKTIDEDRTADLVEIARPMTVTFHKAFDVTPDPYEALEVLLDVEIDRVLTSGHAETARVGVFELAGLLKRAGGEIGILAGGRIGLDDIKTLLAAGLNEIHVGSSVMTDGVVDAAKVRALVEAFKG